MTETTIQYIDLKRIKPSKTNPRKHFDHEALKELADSIREQGIIQPLIVRGDWCVGKTTEAVAKLNGDAERKDADFFEIIAGERRYRAAGLAKLATAPVIVRVLGDQETRELQLIENLQRDDLDPFEEAEGYKRLLDLRDGHGNRIHTVDTIHRRVGKSRRRIYFRLKLLRAPEAVRKAVLDKVLAVAIAEEIGSIPTKELREAAAEEILHPDETEGPLSARRAREEVLPRYTRSLAGAPFDVNDAMMVDVLNDEQTGERIGGGACADCPMRTGNMEAIIGKTKRGDVCTNPKCFVMKCDAQFARLQENAVKEGKRVLTSEEVAENFETNSNNVNFGGLRFDSDFVKLTDKPDVHEVRQDFSGKIPNWKTSLDGLPETQTVEVPATDQKTKIVTMVKRTEKFGRPEIAIARDPRGRVIELVERELAIEAINRAAKQKGERSLFDRSTRPLSLKGASSAASSGTGDASSGVEPAWKKQARKNREIAKLNFQTTLAGIEALENAIVASGPVKGFWDALIGISIEHAGHDGCWLICKLLDLDPKAKNHRTKLDGVEGAVLEYGLSLDNDKQKIGYLATLLISQRAKIYNSGAMGGIRHLDVFKSLAKLYKIDVDAIERRISAEGKAKSKTQKKTSNGQAPVVGSPGPAQRNSDKELLPVKHMFEHIADNKYRCKGCGAMAVKPVGKNLGDKTREATSTPLGLLLVAKEFRGKPCSQSELIEKLSRGPWKGRKLKSKKTKPSRNGGTKPRSKKGGVKK